HLFGPGRAAIMFDGLENNPLLEIIEFAALLDRDLFDGSQEQGVKLWVLFLDLPRDGSIIERLPAKAIGNVPGGRDSADDEEEEGEAGGPTGGAPKEDDSQSEQREDRPALHERAPQPPAFTAPGNRRQMGLQQAVDHVLASMRAVARRVSEPATQVS